ncbi:MAG TPA: hypothetical protein VF828_03595 [Patescibacteria group bacterium]
MAKSQPTPLSDHFDQFKKTLEGRKKYLKMEYQAYGLELAQELGDWKNRAMYIRMAKTMDRLVLEKARYFIKDQDPKKIKTPYKLFLWKIKEIRTQAQVAKDGT